MDVKNIRDATDWFEVLQTSKRTQTAMMTLKPGKHPGANRKVTRIAIKSCWC